MNQVKIKPGVNVWLLAVLLLLWAIPAAAKMKVDFDPNVDFTKFKTFAYIGGVEQLVAMQLNPNLISDRVHRTATRELTAKGLREVQPNENPDLAVRYWANSSTDQNVGVRWNFGVYGDYTGSYWGFWYTQMDVHNQKQASLMLDLIDPHRKDLVWRLYIQMKVYNLDKAWNTAKKDATKGFESFPPSAKEVADKKKERIEHPPKKETPSFQ